MDWLRFEEWPTADEWQAWWAFMTVVVGAVAAWFALRQHRTSVRSNLEQARPFVTVDFWFFKGTIALEVKNTGLTAAEGIKFQWSEHPVADGARAQAAIDRTLVNEGIPFLAPGRSIRFLVGSFDEDTAPRRYRVIMTYLGSGTRHRWDSQSTLDLDQWAEALADRDPYESLVTPLKQIADEARRRSRGRLAPTFETRAAEALYAYLEAQPEVKRYRRHQAREIAERNRKLAERTRQRGVRSQGETAADGRDRQN